MLIYHPAFDIYNCAFRILQLLNNVKNSEIELDRIRIWDFYLTFPNEARKIKFPQDLQELKRIFKDKPNNPYEDLIDPMRISEKMKPFQISALRYLASYGLIDNNLFLKNIIKRTEVEIPKDLSNSINNLSIEKQNIIKLVQGLHDLTLWNIKERTGLIEFRYDKKN